MIHVSISILIVIILSIVLLFIYFLTGILDRDRFAFERINPLPPFRVKRGDENIVLHCLRLDWLMMGIGLVGLLSLLPALLCIAEFFKLTVSTYWGESSYERAEAILKYSSFIVVAGAVVIFSYPVTLRSEQGQFLINKKREEITAYEVLYIFSTSGIIYLKTRRKRWVLLLVSSKEPTPKHRGRLKTEPHQPQRENPQEALTKLRFAFKRQGVKKEQNLEWGPIMLFVVSGWLFVQTLGLMIWLGK